MLRGDHFILTRSSRRPTHALQPWLWLHALPASDHLSRLTVAAAHAHAHSPSTAPSSALEPCQPQLDRYDLRPSQRSASSDPGLLSRTRRRSRAAPGSQPARQPAITRSSAVCARSSSSSSSSSRSSSAPSCGDVLAPPHRESPHAHVAHQSPRRLRLTPPAFSAPRRVVILPASASVSASVAAACRTSRCRWP